MGDYSTQVESGPELEVGSSSFGPRLSILPASGLRERQKQRESLAAT